MSDKPPKDNVIALKKRGRPRLLAPDLNAVEIQPPAKVSHKKLLDRAVYEVTKDQLDYNPDTGVFVWKSESCKKAWVRGRIAGSKNNLGQLVIMVNKRKIYAHRLAWFFVHGDIPDCSIDHINRNPLDNRISNLRLANFSQNAANRKSTRGEFLRGVRRKKTSVGYSATICKNGKSILLGTYDTEQEAHEAYLAAAQKLHGEFACDVKVRRD
jgi:hypothetical protein